jgi:hypothetical protein
MMVSPPAMAVMMVVTNFHHNLRARCWNQRHETIMRELQAQASSCSWKQPLSLSEFQLATKVLQALMQESTTSIDARN